MTVPNVLATRYAGADLAEIWSPEHKIVLERQLWVAVLKAQRDLGIAVPDGAWRWKDVQDLAPSLASGRITHDELLATLAAAAEVADLLDRGDRWWAPWDGWAPADGMI